MDIESLVDRITTAAQIKPLLNTEDVCKILNISRSTFDRMRAAGRIPKPDLYVGTGKRQSPRWEEKTIRRWIDQHSKR